VDLARRVKDRGGFDVIYHDNQWRTFLTALVYSAIMPEAKIANVGMCGQSQALGELEGQPVNEDTIARMQHFIVNPNERPPGRSSCSTRDGETFTEYRTRWLDLVEDLNDEASVGKRVAIITHNRNIHMLDSLGPGGEVDLHLMNAPGPAPNTIHRLEGAGVKEWNGSWIKEGVYLIRHAETEWN
jgi:broad specificity phosphatase PhoE